MIHISKLLQHYKREDIQNAILEHSENREIAIKYGDKGFGKRPDILKYKRDILEAAKQGATSFHASEELWKDPLRVDTLMRKEELDELRIGWDLVLDIDSKDFEYSKICTYLLVNALKYHDVNCSVKFSGNKGFHIGVPFNSFPNEVNGIKTSILFPEGPRRIALYLREFIKKNLSKKILELTDINQLKKKTGKKYEELVKNNEFDPYSVIDIDTILLSPRHLYRMPYCFNEKSGLISIPIDPNKVLEFQKDFELNFEHKFLANGRKNEAKNLLIHSFDYTQKEEEKKKESYEEYTGEAIPEQFFPPCIKKILNGLKDGKKRALFILTNFLSCTGYSYDEIEKIAKEWNKKNNPPLRENYFIGQIRYFKTQKKKVPPPNCNNMMYYKDIGICFPNNLCNKIKNPVNYARRKTYYLNKEKNK